MIIKAIITADNDNNMTLITQFLPINTYILLGGQSSFDLQLNGLLDSFLIIFVHLFLLLSRLHDSELLLSSLLLFHTHKLYQHAHSTDSLILIMRQSLILVGFSFKNIDLQARRSKRVNLSLHIYMHMYRPVHMQNIV